MASASQIPKRNLGRQSWSPRPTEATLVVRSEGPMWSSAPTERRGGFRNHPGQRRAAKRLRQRMGGRGGNRSRDHPQRGQQRRTIPPSRMRRDSSLCTREPWGRGCGLPRRPVGPPRNDNRFLSFRGAERRGNPSFLRWTGVRAAEVVGPYGKPNQPPKPAGAQRSVRARGREGWAGIGAKTIPKEGPLPRPPGQRLAKRKARKEELVKFGFCPMTSECSTAHQVRKSQQSPARALVGAAVTE